MRSPKTNHERMEQSEKLIHNFSMLKRWLSEDNKSYLLYDNQSGEKFFLDSSDIEMLIDGLDMVYIGAKRNAEKLDKWCEVQVHVNLKDLDKKSGKHGKKKSKDRK